MSRAKGIATTSLAAAAAVALSGCGLGAGNVAPPENSQPKPKQNPQQLAATALKDQAAAEQRAFRSLPQPSPGVVNVASGAALGITDDIRKRFQALNPGEHVGLLQTSSAHAFHLLCSGQADVAETTRPPSAAELAECAANGITFPEDDNGNPVPLVLAADGIVVATKNEADVGGDCLKRSTVRQIFQPASTINNWSQLGFFNLPLKTTGRDQTSDSFQLFANLVLGKQSTATLSDVRSDYQAQTTDASVRDLVTGDPIQARLLQEEHLAIVKDVKLAAPMLKQASSRAFNQATANVLAQIAAANQALAKTKKVLTAAQKTQIAAANAALLQTARLQAQAAADSTIIAGIKTRVSRDFAARLASAANPGNIGVFRFTYYELYEEKLRPMEIWDPVTTVTQLQDEGVAVTSSTAKEYRSVDTRAQAGGGVGKVVTYYYRPTSQAPGSSYIAAGNVGLTVPAGGPVNTATVPNCIFPSRQTITSGVYPLSVRLLAYIPKYRIRRPEVVNYLTYYLGKGQSVVQTDRLVPLDEKVQSKEYQAVTGHSIPASLLTRGAIPLGTVGTAASGTGSTPGSSTTSTGAAPTSTTGSAAGSTATSDGNGNNVSKSSGIG